MNITQKTLAALLVSSTGFVGIASATEISGNVGVTTDYIWRGYSQNDGGTSASGGLDADFGNGFYVGAWIGDTAGEAYGTQEIDAYFGYGGQVGAISYDVGYLAYLYPSSQAESDVDFSEIYVTLGRGPVSVSVYYLADADGYDAGDSTYLSLDYETELPGEWGLALHYGDYASEDFGTADSTDVSVTLSKDDFSIALISADGDDVTGADEDTRAVISWGIGF